MFTLRDIAAAGEALERLAHCRELNEKALLRVTRYYKWTIDHRDAIRAVREALGRELGEADPDRPGRFHIAQGSLAHLEYGRRLVGALSDPVEVPADLHKISCADLAPADLSPGELAAAWFLIQGWSWPAGGDLDALSELSGRDVAAAGLALARISNTRGYGAEAARALAPWIWCLLPALQEVQECLIEAGTYYGTRLADSDRFDIPPTAVAAYEAAVGPVLDGPASIRAPLPPRVALAALRPAGLNASELASIGWMLAAGGEGSESDDEQ